jgi:transcriptional regulator with XRE-family HTH domain
MVEKLKFVVGKNIRKRRQREKLTQKDLAELADIDEKYFQRIEGKIPPNISLKLIERIAKALNVHPSKLLL